MNLSSYESTYLCGRSIVCCKLIWPATIMSCPWFPCLRACLPACLPMRMCILFHHLGNDKTIYSEMCVHNRAHKRVAWCLNRIWMSRMWISAKQHPPIFIYICDIYKPISSPREGGLGVCLPVCVCVCVCMGACVCVLWTFLLHTAGYVQTLNKIACERNSEIGPRFILYRLES